jgi:hypothetical protein
MAQWLAHSNQKLYQARLLLETLGQFNEDASQQDSGKHSSAALIDAMQESVLFQLVLAYQSYLHELAEIAQYREEFYSLSQLLENVTVATGEMTELSQLEFDNFSWLSQLQSAFQQCSQKEVVIAVRAQTSPQMIQLNDTTAHTLPLQEWYDALTSMIELQRNNRQES